MQPGAAERLAAIARQLEGVGAGPDAATVVEADIVAIAPPGPVADADVVAIETLAFDGATVFAPQPVEAGVVEIESLAPSDVVAIESLAPTDRLPLERAFDTYRRLMSAAPAHAPAPAIEVEPAPPPMRRATDLPPVDVRSLCYSGRGALERAAEVRAEITGRLADSGDFRAVEPLLRELLDLVPLALDPAH